MKDLFTPEGLLLDRDGDGLADGIAALIIVDETTPAAAAIDLAARLGLESQGLDFPVAVTRASIVAQGWPTGRVPVLFGPGWQDWRPCADALPAAGGSVAWVQYGERKALHVASNSPATGRWLAAEWPPTTTTTDAIDGATGRRGLSSLIQFFGPQGCLASTGYFPDRAHLDLHLTGDETPEEVAALCNLAARIGVEATGLRFPLAVLPDEQPRGRLAVRLAAGGHAGRMELDAEGGVRVTGAPAARAQVLEFMARHWPRELDAAWDEGLWQRLASVLHPQSPEPPTAQRTLEWTHPWEGDRFWKRWQETVLPRLRPGDRVAVDLRLSEPEEVRQEVAAAITTALHAAGCTAQVVVRSAYKQGFEWIREEVLPQLRQFPDITAIRIAYRRFPGDGAAIGIRNVSTSGLPTKDSLPDLPVLDLPIRWLQELYPIDELLASELGLPLSAITFAELPADASHPTYQVTAWAGERPLFSSIYQAVTSERPYLDAYPHLGRVHPPTGWLRVMQNEALLVDERLPSDLEAFWAFYQQEALPWLIQQVEANLGGTLTAEAQPFFSRLAVEVQLSEDDRRLGIREEMISPLNALHEDIYFATLDHLAAYGHAHAGQPFQAPGPVQPWVRQGLRKATRVRLTLEWQTAAPAAEAPLPALTALEVDAQGTLTRVRWADRWFDARPAPEPAAPGVPSPLDRVIGPEEMAVHAARLKHLPGLRVWQAGHSYQGRPIFAVAAASCPAAICPPQKLSAFKPTVILIGRHHANEVASTNAHLRLAEQLVGDEEVRRLLQRVNVVMIPLENVDGAALHYAMQREHPHWTLHAARFNALGYEFAADYANDDGMPEARVLPALWRAYLPDMILDDHGVPAHEWVQPFSGFASAPSFAISYWIPNIALIYAIFRTTGSAAQAEMVEGMRQAFVEAVRSDPMVAAWNARLLERYRTFAHDRLPEKFPLTLTGAAITYLWQAPAGSRGFSVRHPDITRLEWVTEVPDETAQGEHLARCVHAHWVADVAALTYLGRQAKQPQICMNYSDQGILRKILRKR